MEAHGDVRTEQCLGCNEDYQGKGEYCERCCYAIRSYRDPKAAKMRWQLWYAGLPKHGLIRRHRR